MPARGQIAIMVQYTVVMGKLKEDRVYVAL